MSRLLLLGCSERKLPNPGRLPAVERYDGPAYRVLRRYARSKSHEVPDVLILSAKFGLIQSSEPIPAYDFPMTPQRALKLRAATTKIMKKLVIGKEYQSICVSAGVVYREILLTALLDNFPQDRIVSPTGSQGVQLAHLKAWLYGNDPESSSSEAAALNRMIPVQLRLCGRTYEIAPCTVTSVVVQALKNGSFKGLRATAWYVLVDGQRVPPKWLLSQLTGVPLGNFHTEEARRALAQLGLIARQA